MIIKKNKNKKLVQEAEQETIENKQEPAEEEVSPELVFDISDIDFNSRIERRQGDRRRGYRRIGDRSLVSRAQQEAISIKENARISGYQEGLKNAQKDIEKLENSLKNFLALEERIYDEISPKILDISMEVAKKIIKQEVEANQDLLKGIILDALGKLTKNEKQIVLKVSPLDKDYVKSNIDEVLSQAQIEARVSIQQDSTLIKGSVIVETSNGLIDASINTGLQIIEELFKNMQGE